MKKVFLFFIAIIIAFSLTSCAIAMPAPKPKEGVWFCDELNVSIDFSIQDARCGKLHADDGSYQQMLVHFDYWNGVTLAKGDYGDETEFLIGCFKYKKDKFIITSYENDKDYVFIKEDAVS